MKMARAVAGTWLFILNEATFFLILILAFGFFHVIHAAQRPPLDATTTFLFSLCLFASSFTVWCAGRAGSGARKAWLLVTLVLGVVFLWGQAREWSRLIASKVTISADPFASAFFTLTGFHGLHVILGLLLLAALLVFAFDGEFEGRRRGGFEAVSLYWHFVDAVWVVLFVLVYVWR